MSTTNPVRARRRAAAATVVPLTLLVLVAIALAAVLLGSSKLTPIQTLQGLVDPSAPGWLIVQEFRLPRIVAGLLVGAALGLAGALSQSLARNPLATPDILGVTSGATLGAIVVIVLGGGASVGSTLLGVSVPVAATLGGLAAAGAIMLLGWNGGVAPFRVILIGIGLTSLIGGLSSYLFYSANLIQASAAAQWLVGSLSAITWTSIWPLLVTTLLVGGLSLTLGRGLDLSLLGDDVARGLGLRVERHRVLVIVAVSVLTAAATAAAGPIAFVALVAPQLALRSLRTPRPPLLLSAAMGAALILAADTAGRALVTWEVPVGILTAVLGAPYLIWLLIRRPTTEAAA